MREKRGSLARFAVRRKCEVSLLPRANAPLNGLHLLDIGCGGGLLSEAMAKLGARVQGVDVIERNILIAQTDTEQQSLAIDDQTSTAEEWRHPDGFTMPC